MNKEETNKINTEELNGVLIAVDANISANTLSESREFKSRAKYNIRIPIKFNVHTVNACLIVIAFIASVSYLLLSNNLISQGFALNEARNKVSALTKENRELELEAMSLGSYENINEKISQLGMVDVGKVDYIELKTEGVARR